MKKIFSITLLLAAAVSFTACVNEEDDLFDKSAAERLNEASELYSSRLTAQPNGWAVQLYPTTQNEAPYGNGYLLLFRFHSDHSVDASMNNELSNNKYITDTSNWDVITDMGPVLSFNTHNNVVHTFSDPEDIPSSSSSGTTDDEEDETGTGVGGDYEFVIVDAPEDASYMMLKGKKRGTYNLLTPVEEGVDYEAYLTDVKAFQSKMFPSNSPTFDVMHIGDTQYKIEGADDGIPNIYPYDADAIIDESFNPFLITKRGDDYYLRFRDEKEYGDTTVQEFKYIADKDIFESTDNASCYISGDEPLRYYNEKWLSPSSRCQWDSESGSSDSYAQLLGSLVSQMSAYKYTFNYFRFFPKSSADGLSVEDGKAIMRLTYKLNGRTYSIDYNYDYTRTDNGISFSFSGASNQLGQNAMNAFPSIKSLLEALNGEFTVGPAETAFNLNNMRFTSVADTGMWFNFALN